MTNKNIEAECALCLVGDCHATAYKMSSTALNQEIPKQQPIDAEEAFEHINEAGILGIVPASLLMCVITLDAEKGAIASDEMHDAIHETAVAYTIGIDGERQAWFVAPPTGVNDGRWKHGRIVWKAGIVAPVTLTRIVGGISERTSHRNRPVDLKALPEMTH